MTPRTKAPAGTAPFGPIGPLWVHPLVGSNKQRRKASRRRMSLVGTNCLSSRHLWSIWPKRGRSLCWSSTWTSTLRYATPRLDSPPPYPMHPAYGNCQTMVSRSTSTRPPATGRTLPRERRRHENLLDHLDTRNARSIGFLSTCHDWA